MSLGRNSKTSSPLVSVFMPVYNQESFVGSAIESVLNQTYDNIEIVIGDDCSIDDTWKIVSDYQARFPEKIIAFRNEDNLGITVNCNRVLKHCRGKYVAFTAGDDLFLPEKIAKQVAAMEADERIVLCYHDVEVFQSETNKTIRFTNSGPRSTAPISGLARKVARRVVESGNAIFAGMSVMVRREAIPKTGYDHRVPYASDWLMWIEVLAGADANARVAFLPEVLVRYRRHENNITNRSEVFQADPYVTLAITEATYPWLASYIRKGWGRVRYYRGIEEILRGNYALGRKLLLQSLWCTWVSPKFFYWLVVSYFPRIRKQKNR